MSRLAVALLDLRLFPVPLVQGFDCRPEASADPRLVGTAK